jgi:hypothetical protein
MIVLKFVDSGRQLMDIFTNPLGCILFVDAKVDLQTQRANTRFYVKACQLI